MPPIPCAHCGLNFMKSTHNQETTNLCNNCIVRENVRTKKVENTDQVKITINCSRQMQIEIEEYCINKGVSFDAYFQSLHEATKHHDVETLFAPEMFGKELDKHTKEVTQEEERSKKKKQKY